MNRPALVEAARESIAAGSASFATASRLFDRATRERAWLLYAWCRACDDLADGQQLGHGVARVDKPATRLAAIRMMTEQALAQRPTGNPAFDAIGVVAHETRMPHDLPRALVEGFALDAAGWRPATEGDLYRYCYHVAGVVGVMMAIVMGVSPQDDAVLDRACDLGIAFQLANIVRDLRDDAVAGRCYLPQEWLAEAGVRPDGLLTPPARDAVATLVRRLAARAADYEASARHGTPALSFRSAWAVLAAAGIYGDIAREAARAGAGVLDRRIVTSRTAKAGWVLRAALLAARRRRWRGGDRDGLWTRPRGDDGPQPIADEGFRIAR